MHVSAWCLALLWSTLPVLANVEKTIFVAPASVAIPHHRPNLDDLHLVALSPLIRSIRYQVPVIFPTSTLPEGAEIWLLLEGLNELQRYEVRVCWAATVSPPL